MLCPHCTENSLSAGSQRLLVPFSVALALCSDLITHIYCKTTIHIPLDWGRGRLCAAVATYIVMVHKLVTLDKREEIAFFPTVKQLQRWKV